ncbi:hypothetical protein CDAR_446671 [Caerostris darwini]|uniref:Uncharacterized protein n=1 Tax=Caerostris darwini TaxID=1538125 RepID=A0AAV4PNK0_9ARAC|nr:hypothetical protein CDAR_446671 [Caerostris darwini]
MPLKTPESEVARRFRYRLTSKCFDFSLHPDSQNEAKKVNDLKSRELFGVKDFIDLKVSRYFWALEVTGFPYGNPITYPKAIYEKRNTHNCCPFSATPESEFQIGSYWVER